MEIKSMYKGQEMPAQEYVMSTASVQHLANLEIGQPGANRITSQLTPDQYDEFGQQLGNHIEALTIHNSLDCMDDRPTVSLEDGTTDLVVLRDRIAGQWAGGTYLAATKAAVAADLAIVSGAKDIWSAYLTVADSLTKLGWEDAGHEGCGASGNVESSAAEPIADEIILPTLGAMIEIDASRTDSFRANSKQKQRLVEAGFYSQWSPEQHMDFIKTNFPHNFSYLQTAADAVHGHKAQAVLTITGEAKGFAKNAFVEDTGQMAFGATLAPITKLVEQLAAPAERERLLLAFLTDLMDVSDKLVDKGMPAFVDAA